MYLCSSYKQLVYAFHYNARPYMFIKMSLLQVFSIKTYKAGFKIAVLNKTL